MADNNLTNPQMFWRLIFRALRLKLQRVMVIFAALSVGAAIVTAMSGVYFDINTKMSQELRTFGANFYLGNPHNGFIKDDTIDQVMDLAPKGLITAASPYLYGVARSEAEKVVLMGVWFDAMRTLAPYWQITGQRIDVNFDTRNAMIGKSLASRLNLNVGDKITLIKEDGEKHSFNIKGIIEAGDATDNMLVVNLDFAQAWLDKKGLASNAQFNVRDDKGQVKAFATLIHQKFPDLDAHAILKVSASEGQILNKIKGLMGLIAIVILVLATLCVNTTLIAIVGERSQEFALQKALGATQRDIVKQIVTEILLIAIVATGVGLILGYILAQILGQTVFHAHIDMRLPVFPIVVSVSLAVALISVILPTKRALSIQTAQVLKGE